MRRRIALQSLVSTLGFGALLLALAAISDNAFLGAARWFFAAAALLPALVMTWRAAAAYLVVAGGVRGRRLSSSTTARSHSPKCR